MSRELSRANEDYLKVVWNLREVDGKASTSALAAKLKLAASTVSEAVKKLTVQGYLTHDPYGSIDLTPQGLEVALAVVRRHRVVEAYLHDELGYAWDEVHQEAEILEHVVSDRLVDAMYERLGCPDFDPHGDPIPHADGSIPKLLVKPLPTVVAVQQVTIFRIRGAAPPLLRYLEEHKLMPGQVLQVLGCNKAAGVLLVEVAGQKVTLGITAAEVILVQ